MDKSSAGQRKGKPVDAVALNAKAAMQVNGRRRAVRHKSQLCWKPVLVGFLRSVVAMCLALHGGVYRHQGVQLLPTAEMHGWMLPLVHL